MTNKPKKMILPDLAYLKPNYKYAISWDDHGVITSLATLEKMDLKTTYTPYESDIPEDEMSMLVDILLNSVENGSMVMAFTNHEGAELYPAHKLGEGFILYIKKPIAQADNIESIINAMYEARNTVDSDLVVRFKRRQGKWFLYAGSVVDESEANLTESTKDTLNLYSLGSRSHITLTKGDEE